MASKVAEDDRVFFEDEREERLSEFGAIGTSDGGFEVVVITGEGKGFNYCRMRAVHCEHVDG